MEHQGTQLARVDDHHPSERHYIQTPPRILLTVEAAADQLSIGRTTMYALIKAGAVESVLVGRLRRIPVEALVRYLERLRADLRQSDDSAA